MVVLTTYAEDRSVVEALRAGARDVLTKDAGADEIESAIAAVVRGDAAIDPAVQRHPVDAVAAPPEPPDGLTPRELEVLALIAQGLSNGKIAARLVVSEATVEATSTISSPRPASATAHRPSAMPTAKGSPNERPRR